MDDGYFTYGANGDAMYGRIDNEVPALLGRFVVAADGDAAVVLSATLFSVGMELHVEMRRRLAPAADDSRDFLQSPLFVGLQLSDGTRVIAGRTPRGVHGHRLTERGGHSDGRSAARTFWFWPSLPAGDVVVIVQAPELGLPEARLVMSGTDLAAARGRIVELWPWTPRASEDTPRPEPVAPAGGWFAEVEPSA